MAAAPAGFILLHAYKNESHIYRVAIAAIDYYSAMDTGSSILLRSGQSRSVSESPETIDRLLL